MSNIDRLPGKPTSLLRTITAKKDVAVNIFISPAFAEAYIEFVEEYGITVRVVLDTESLCKVVAAFDRAELGGHDKVELITGTSQTMLDRWGAIRHWFKKRGIL